MINKKKLTIQNNLNAKKVKFWDIIMRFKRMSIFIDQAILGLSNTDIPSHFTKTDYLIPQSLATRLLNPHYLILPAIFHFYHYFQPIDI